MGHRPAMKAVGQNAVRVDESILVPRLTSSFPVQKWNTSQGRQVHYTDAAVEADRSSSIIKVVISQMYWRYKSVSILHNVHSITGTMSNSGLN